VSTVRNHLHDNNLQHDFSLTNRTKSAETY
jgi:hypothetical protein